MKEISLTQRQTSIVAGDDHKWLSEVGSWFARWNHHTKSFYAVRNIGRSPNQRSLRMHNAIWEHHHGPIPKGFTVDHIDRDTLNNRHSNLRLATKSQQMHNRGLLGSNTSGYRGVSFKRSNGKWQAEIMVDGKGIRLGCYDDKDDAARAYDAAAREHFGEFAQLNFPARSNAA